MTYKNNLTEGLEVDVRRITKEDGLIALREEWNRLLDHCHVATFQLTWEWMYTWWKTFSCSERQLVVIVCYSNQRLVGIAPFVMRPRRILEPFTVRRLEFMGTGEPEADEVATEYPDIIAENSFEPQVVEAVWRHIQEANPTWDEAVFINILHDSNVLRFLLPLTERTKVWHTQYACGQRFFIPLPTAWEAYLEQLGSKKQRLLYIQRKLKRLGDIKHYRILKDDDLPAAFDELRRLHTLRWTTKGQSGVFASERFNRFHCHLMQLLRARDLVELRFVQKDGENIACVYNFCYGDTVYYYQSGLDKAAAPNISLGMIVHAEAIKAAIESGFKCFDMMRGKSNTYKQDYQCATTPMYRVTLYNKTFKGGVLHSSHRVLDALRRMNDSLNG
jgi:CelD/BcsL family acetyltransferase involved in cellulose biosynthesis